MPRDSVLPNMAKRRRQAAPNPKWCRLSCGCMGHMDVSMKAAETAAPEADRESNRTGRRAYAVALMLIVAALAGAAAGAVALRAWVIPILGLGGVQRIIELGHILERGWDTDDPIAIVLGNSVSVEGYDAAIIEQHAPPGWRAKNMAINGCDVMELHVFLPRVLEAEPSAIVLTLRAVDLGRPPNVPVDKAYAYALANITDSYAAPLDRESLGMSRESFAALHAGRTRATLHFRTAPTRWVNDEVRQRIRRDMREPDPADTIAPYNLLGSIHGERLERHLNTVMEVQAERLAAGEGVGVQLIEQLVAKMAESGAVPILCAAPQHPRLRERDPARDEALRNLLRELAAEHRGVFIDATELLDEEHFADAVHPNAAGRGKLSELIGRNLPPAVPRQQAS
jgi:hypothetical protein